MRLLVIFAAMSQVKRLKRVLEAGGAYFEMERAPQCVASGGCSIALHCTPETLPLVLEAARCLAIEPRGLAVPEGTPGQPWRLLGPGEAP